jgi:hypothetical protein
VIYTLVESKAIPCPDALGPAVGIGKCVYETSEPAELYFNTNILPGVAGKVRPDTTAGGKPIVYIWTGPFEAYEPVIYTFCPESMAILKPEIDNPVPVKYVYETSAPVDALYFNANILYNVFDGVAGKVRPDTTAGGKPIV